MRRYLAIFFLVLCAGLAVFAAASAHRYWTLRDLDENDERLGQLLRYQEQKIERLPAGSVDTVFVGDSSLGTAIDVKAFDAAAGTKSVSLALTGSFGYGGGLVLLRHLAERQSPRNVVLFYSIDAMARGAAYSGYFFASPLPFATPLPWKRRVELLKTYAIRLLNGQSIRRLAWGLLRGESLLAEPPPSLVADDYIIAHAQFDLSKIAYAVPRRVVSSSTVFLQEVAHLCRAQQWNCVYVHGPVWERPLTDNPHAGAYLSASRDAIEATGFTVPAQSPVTVQDEERGDSVFHVAFDRRPEFSERYAKLLRPYLK